MKHNILTELHLDEDYKLLLHKRRKLTTPLVVLTLLIYYSFIAVLAFYPQELSVKVGDGVTSVGIYVGLGVIFSVFAITGIYVHQANKHLYGLADHIRNKLSERG